MKRLALLALLASCTHYERKSTPPHPDAPGPETLEVRPLTILEPGDNGNDAADTNRYALEGAVPLKLRLDYEFVLDAPADLQLVSFTGGGTCPAFQGATHEIYRRGGVQANGTEPPEELVRRSWSPGETANLAPGSYVFRYHWWASVACSHFDIAFVVRRHDVND